MNTGKRISIRKYRAADTDNFYEAVLTSVDAITEWLPWCNKDYDRADAEKWILNLVPEIWKTQSGCEFLIVDEQDTILGACCLEQPDRANKEASVGYWVRSDQTKKGVATEASLLLLEYGFEQLMLEQIKVIPSIENVASVKVAEKLPYADLVRVKDGFQIRNKRSDALVYSITKASYFSEMATEENESKPDSKFELSLLKVEDAVAYRKLKLRAYKESPLAFSTSYEDELIHDLASSRQELQVIGSPPESFVVGAFTGEQQLVGIARFQRDRRSKARHKSMIHTMYVAPEYRLLKVGKKLLEKTFDLVSKIEGLEQIHLWVLITESNDVRNFYKRNGFEIQGAVVKKDLKIDGQYVDAVYMVKYLQV